MINAHHIPNEYGDSPDREVLVSILNPQVRLRRITQNRLHYHVRTFHTCHSCDDFGIHLFVRQASNVSSRCNTTEAKERLTEKRRNKELPILVESRCFLNE
jgi:hypothetical protein